MAVSRDLAGLVGTMVSETKLHQIPEPGHVGPNRSF